MGQDKRKPPGGGRLSGRDVRADGFDTSDIDLRAHLHKPEPRRARRPAGFNPAAHPIICRHWFGVEPFRLIGEVAANLAVDLKRQRQIEHVHQLGVRAVGELLYEVAEGEDLDRALETYGRLTPDLLKAVGGDRFPPAPIHEVVS